jgi:hypothetical protein
MPDDTSDIMLTTTDNPYSPFTEWDQWWQYDTSMGYDTANFLARVCKTSNDLSEADQDLAITNAILEIVRENVRGIYKVATREKTTA